MMNRLLDFLGCIRFSLGFGLRCFRGAWMVYRTNAPYYASLLLQHGAFDDEHRVRISVDALMRANLNANWKVEDGSAGGCE